MKKKNPFPRGKDVLWDSVRATKWDAKMRRRHRRLIAWKALKDYLKELWGN
jgi:hypothetical protein